MEAHGLRGALRAASLAVLMGAWASPAHAQDPQVGRTADRFAPRLAISVGVGNTFGGFGAAAEVFPVPDRVSVVAAVGRVPDIGIGVRGFTAYAVGARAHFGSASLRPYVEGAWVVHGSSRRTTAGGAVEEVIHYGVGISGGVLLRLGDRFRLLAGAGAGSSDADESVVINLGLGVLFGD